jgi:arabinan endo-1,5-alpha-L-arabinosidase
MKTYLQKGTLLFVMMTMIIFTLPAQDRSVIAHDPVMIREGGTYYLFHTGNGVQVKSSKDMQSWKDEAPVFSQTPDWVLKAIPEFRGSMWAPDIYFRDGTYYLYYSVSAFGRNTSAIGVATNTTLNPSDPDYKWVDHGQVIQSVPGRDMWNAIDANVIVDDQGTPWMSFGSFWMGLKLVKLKDNMKEVVSDSTQEWYTIAAREREFGVDDRDAGDAANPNLDYASIYSPEQLQRNRRMENGAIEAPFIFKKGEYYYLFVSWDRCCRGVESSYKILVGRSKDIRGPYLDKEGANLTYGGGTLVAKGNEEWAAVGHQAAYTFDDKDYLIFHAYDRKDEGRPKLRIEEISWEEGWPEINLD